MENLPANGELATNWTVNDLKYYPYLTTVDGHQISFNWSTRGIYIDKGSKVGSF